MGNLVKSLGIIGVSEGNGHPFSYSSIINGFSPEGLAVSGWPGIYEYVRRRHASEFGLGDWKVTHAWTQNPEIDREVMCCMPHPESRCLIIASFLARWMLSSLPAMIMNCTFKWPGRFLKPACRSLLISP